MAVDRALMKYDYLIAGMVPKAKELFDRAIANVFKMALEEMNESPRSGFTLSSRGELFFYKRGRRKLAAKFEEELLLKPMGAMLEALGKINENRLFEAIEAIVAAVQLKQRMLLILGEDRLKERYRERGGIPNTQAETDALGIWATGKADWMNAASEMLVTRAASLARMHGNYAAVKEIVGLCTALVGVGSDLKKEGAAALAMALEDSAKADIIHLTAGSRACAKSGRIRDAVQLLRQAKNISAENSRNPHEVNPNIYQAEKALGWKGDVVGAPMDWKQAFRRQKADPNFEKVKKALLRNVRTPRARVLLK